MMSHVKEVSRDVHHTSLQNILPSLGSPLRSNGGQLSSSDDPQADVSGHLISHLPSLLPQLKPLRVRGVLHRPGQHNLAHKLVLHRVAVPHLRKTSRIKIPYMNCVSVTATKTTGHLQGFKQAADSDFITLSDNVIMQT